MTLPLPLIGIRRILLIRIGKIGDLIVSNFAFRKIRASFPHAEIMLLTLPRNRELLRYNRTCDRVRYFRKGLDILPLIVQARLFRPDLLLDFNDNPSNTSALLARFSSAATKVGFGFPKALPFLTRPVTCPPKESSHITDRLRLIPEAIGLTFTPEEVVPSLTLGGAESAEVELLLKGIRAEGRRIIAVNLSAGDRSRYWQETKWQELLARIAVEEQEARFVLLTAPGEEALAAGIAATCRPHQVLVPGKLDFHRFASFIAHADLLISPDTSAIHIAAAFRTPVLGLYPAVEWNFRSWQPIGTPFAGVRPSHGDVSRIKVEELLEGYRQLTAPPGRS